MPKTVRGKASVFVAFAAVTACPGMAAAQSVMRFEVNLPDATVLAQPSTVLASRPRLPEFVEKALADRPQRHDPTGGRVDRRMKMAHAKVDHDRDGVVTIPHWSDSFDHQGLTYKYTMVGTDPKRGSATTTIPTVLIPLRFVFENGLVMDASADSIDGQTPIQGILGSPIFQRRSFNVGSTNVGRTQYGDAFQRANFWRDVSRRSGDYHVLLEQPAVAPAFEVHVPDDAVFFATDPATGTSFTLIDDGVLFEATSAAIRQAFVSPHMLPIVVWGNVVSFFGVLGFHDADQVPDGVQTYISTSYHPRSLALAEDVYTLSHEVLEWMDDPFADNFTPGWNLPDVSYPHCVSRFAADRLEVADVLEFLVESDVPVSMGPATYHLADGVFLDFFRRVTPSESANGQYTFFGLTSSPSSECAGHIEVDRTTFEFPGATGTVARGVNNRGLIVGYFTDQSNIRHGFLFDGKKFSQLDYPGSTGTFLSKVNDAGQAVGSYVDGDGNVHGFSYWRGAFKRIDVPDSIDHTSDALGINSRGDIVGEFDLTLPITRGFSYADGQYRPIDTPFGQQAEARGVNDRGLIVGDTYDDPFGPPTHGFLFDGVSFTQFDFPGADETVPWTVNNRGMHGGVFFDPEVGGIGYVTIRGNPYEIYTPVFGMDDTGDIVGYAVAASDCDAVGFCQSFRRVGYVARLPKAHADNSGGDR